MQTTIQRLDDLADQANSAPGHELARVQTLATVELARHQFAANLIAYGASEHRDDELDAAIRDLLGLEPCGAAEEVPF